MQKGKILKQDKIENLQMFKKLFKNGKKEEKDEDEDVDKQESLKIISDRNLPRIQKSQKSTETL